MAWLVDRGSTVLAVGADVPGATRIRCSGWSPRR
jgi:hypothetical protein